MKQLFKFLSTASLHETDGPGLKILSSDACGFWPHLLKITMGAGLNLAFRTYLKQL